MLLTSRICGGCNQEIVHGNCLGCMDTYFHPDCFCCYSCGYPITEREVIRSPPNFEYVEIINLPLKSNVSQTQNALCTVFRLPELFMQFCRSIDFEISPHVSLTAFLFSVDPSFLCQEGIRITSPVSRTWPTQNVKFATTL